MVPSIKRLREHWPGKEKVLRGLMEGSIEPFVFASVRAAMWGDSPEPPRGRVIERRLDALNEALDGHGTETITATNRWIDAFWRDAVIVYVNMGETYETTICYLPEQDRFEISSWGDMVESMERRGVRIR